MCGSFGKSSHFVAPSCKLELARFSAMPRIQDGAECGKSKRMNYEVTQRVVTTNHKIVHGRTYFLTVGRKHKKNRTIQLV